MEVVDREQGRLLERHVGREPVEAMEQRKGTGALCRRVVGTRERRRCEQWLHKRGRPREQLFADIWRTDASSGSNSCRTIP